MKKTQTLYCDLSKNTILKGNLFNIFYSLKRRYKGINASVPTKDIMVFVTKKPLNLRYIVTKSNIGRRKATRIRLKHYIRYKAKKRHNSKKKLKT